MSNPLKDRIDILIEKAKSGDAKAQLNLAKCFLSGHLVEKSSELAKYWAYKSLQNGNRKAIEYYRAIVTGSSYSQKKFVELCDKISIFPIWEFFFAFIPFLFMSIFNLDNNTFFTICLWIFCIGFISFIISLFTGKIGESISRTNGKSVGKVLGFIVVHIIALWLTFA